MDKPPFSLTAYMQALAYFEDLKPPDVEALAAQTARRSFGAGETIFLEGDPAAGLWMIERGSVKIYKLSADGTEHVLRMFSDGDTFNDIAALDGGGNPANAAALTDLVTWVLPPDALTGAMLHNSALALRIARVLAQRVRGLVRQIEDLTLYSVVVRLARFLLIQADDPSLSAPGVTRTVIAAHLATTPQTISTALRELESTGAIQFDRHRIVIVDETLLRSIAML